jgi:hypothetical protein
MANVLAPMSRFRRVITLKLRLKSSPNGARQLRRNVALAGRFAKAGGSRSVD